MSEKYSLIYSVFPDAEQAKKVARVLLEEKLIACANVFAPHTAIYEWEGKLCEESEVTLLVKTISDNTIFVQTKIIELHSYETPCVLEIKLDSVSPEFAKWMNNIVKFTY